MFVMCPLLLGWTIFESGNVSQGIQHMGDAVSATRQSARRFYYEYDLLVFAEVLLKAGEPDRAQQIVQEALDRITASRNRLFEAEAHRLSGMCLAILGGERTAEAETRLLQAVETADRQGALSFKLRAATNLGRIWREQNRHHQAHDLLSQVYNQFTEGLDTPDLKDAKALLDDLETWGIQPREGR
jgi:predicted ATPase